MPKFENLKHNAQYLEQQNIPKFTQEDIEGPNSFIIIF